MMIRLASITGIFLSLAVSPVRSEGEEQAAERQSRLTFLTTNAKEFSLQRKSDPDQTFVLTEDPVLRYSNPERDQGSYDGATFLWLDETRPIAAISLSIRRPRDLTMYECTMLQDMPCESRRADLSVWSPDDDRIRFKPLPDAPAPVAVRRLRLAQMRQLARRFTASDVDPRTSQTTELRLLSQPLYRFSHEPSGVIDGVLFAFVISNDPELILQIEAVRGDGDSMPGWRFSVARMSSRAQTVELDGIEVWNSANYYQAGRSRTGPYIEGGIGRYVPGDDMASDPEEPQ